MQSIIKIGNRKIGGGAPCFLVAEAGSNHDGKLSQALRLIDIAAEAGADAVKFQTFRASKLYTERAGRSEYLKLSKSIFEVIREMEMPYEWIPRLASHCRKRGIQFLSTPFDEESADRLAEHVDAFKVASYELTHHPLLRYLAKFRKPVLLSTGAATMSEIARSVQVLRHAGTRALALMQCTASYPAPLESINVRVIESLRKKFGCPCGLSDHSRDPLAAPMAAAAVGADLLEKHFTLDNTLPGPDHKFAVTPPELRELVRRVREVEAARGDGVKTVHPVERELRHFARRSLFASENIPKGARFTARNVVVLRRGNMPKGLSPEQWTKVIGRVSRRSIPKGRPIPAEAVGR